MDRWDSWGDDTTPSGKPVASRVDISNIEDYLRDLHAQEMPVRLELSPIGTRWRARIVDADGPGDVLLDRRGERFMTASGDTPQAALVTLDMMAAVKPEEN